MVVDVLYCLDEDDEYDYYGEYYFGYEVLVVIVDVEIV